MTTTAAHHDDEEEVEEDKHIPVGPDVPIAQRRRCQPSGSMSGRDAACGYIRHMPADGVLRFANRLHRGLIGASAGRLGWTTAGMPVLELTTVGRRSGRERTVMLTTPHQQGDALVIVASRGGDDVHPAWYLNLVENPEAKVAMQGSAVRSMRARVVSSEERERLWPLVTAAYSGYAGYQEKTDRRIPLVVLEPAA